MLSSTTYIDKGGRPALLSLLPFQRVDFYGNYSFRYLWQKRLHFWPYSHHPFYLQRVALSIKHDLQTRPKGQRALIDVQAPLVERRRAAWNGSPPASAWSMELPLV